jgi:hypothetical protein
LLASPSEQACKREGAEVTHYDPKGFRPGELWWVETSGKRYGPFAPARMADFVSEGRIAADTLVCRSGEDWREAQHVPFLAAALAEREPSIEDEHETFEEPQIAIVVWAKIASFVENDFLAALVALGPLVQLEHGMWIVRTTKPMSEVRTRLASVLTTSDRMFLSAVTDRLVGWRNLGPTTEARLRDLFRAVASLSPAND